MTKGRDRVADEGWWIDFFPVFRPVFETMPRKVSSAEANYIMKKLGLRPGSRFLDCPCGIGRISIPLAKKGVRVTGVDIMASYLDELSLKAQRLKLKIDVVHCDMRRIDFSEEFDAAGNLWTSFGFFEKDSDNALVLKKAFTALRPGGRFLLQLANRDWIMANFQPRAWFPVKNGMALEERWFDYGTSINHFVWNFIVDNKATRREGTIRLYSYHELLAMMRSAGFVDIQGYGSINDDPICRERRMMFIIGVRPGRRRRE